MDKQYGNIYINFASPFSLQEYIRDFHVEINNKKNNIIPAIAHEIIYR